MDEYKEQRIDDVLVELKASGDSFVLVRTTGENTEKIHNEVLNTLNDSLLWENVKMIQSVVR